MILLPTRRRLERRRNALYKRLQQLQNTSVYEVEDIMRKIHIINSKIITYFIRDGQHETKELFEDKDLFETEDPTFVQIEDCVQASEGGMYFDFRAEAISTEGQEALRENEI